MIGESHKVFIANKNEDDDYYILTPVSYTHLVASDGTIRDSSNYICVAAHLDEYSRGQVVQTSLGPGKVYDTGCAKGTIDLYTDW